MFPSGLFSFPLLSIQLFLMFLETFISRGSFSACSLFHLSVTVFTFTHFFLLLFFLMFFFTLSFFLSFSFPLFHVLNCYLINMEINIFNINYVFFSAPSFVVFWLFPFPLPFKKKVLAFFLSTLLSVLPLFFSFILSHSFFLSLSCSFTLLFSFALFHVLN